MITAWVSNVVAESSLWVQVIGPEKVCFSRGVEHSGFVGTIAYDGWVPTVSTTKPEAREFRMLLLPFP